jgi:hypothetical protein
VVLVFLRRLGVQGRGNGYAQGLQDPELEAGLRGLGVVTQRQQLVQRELV